MMQSVAETRRSGLVSCICICICKLLDL